MKKLKVVGNARVSAEPDLAVLSFRVEAKNMRYGASLHDLHAKVHRLRDIMHHSGLQTTDLKTTQFAVNPEYHYGNKANTFTGYLASHRLSIELPCDKELINKILDLIAGQETEVQVALQFSVKDKDQLRKKAMAKAVAEAKVNAAVLTESAGVKLGDLIRIHYGTEEVNFYQQNLTLAVCESVDESAPHADIEPESVSIQETVTLTYEIF